jgi:hypothetical protein
MAREELLQKESSESESHGLTARFCVCCDATCTPNNVYAVKRQAKTLSYA